MRDEECGHPQRVADPDESAYKDRGSVLREEGMSTRSQHGEMDAGVLLEREAGPRPLEIRPTDTLCMVWHQIVLCALGFALRPIEGSHSSEAEPHWGSRASCASAHARAPFMSHGPSHNNTSAP